MYEEYRGNFRLLPEVPVVLFLKLLLVNHYKMTEAAIKVLLGT
jgi:hypothetical protein